ncbi:hypothetical protein GWG65_25150 [Bradyrhizobium sp. CSA207]|uniref:hypothetical protein n=1 Tax=Bradyrhizobium sp. CSA207 TaxID=2698826 RepID=UPI0023AF5CA1|nr:hypothetical protein [Bradyrhizobium sp. CSA207]MDE5444678.1 hypothetical protein [Bradyrhizobium sp. CSA207]
MTSVRLTFLYVAGTTFVLLAAATFIFVNPRSLVRSAIEVGTFSFDGKEEPIESPEMLAKRIPAVYVPAALAIAEKNGAQRSTQDAFQNSSADSIGQTVSIQTVVDPAAAEQAKAFHQKIIDQIVGEEGKRSGFVREAAALRTVLLKQISDGVDQQIADYGKMLDRLDGLLPEAEASLRARQLERGSEPQRATTHAEGDNKASPEFDGRRKEITGYLQLLGALSEDRAQSSHDLTVLRARRDSLAFALLEAQIATRAFKSTRITLAPEVMPQPVGAKRFSLLVIAAVASILIAFGALAFLHSFVVKNS